MPSHTSGPGSPELQSKPPPDGLRAYAESDDPRLDVSARAPQSSIAQFSALAPPPDAQLRAYALIDQIVQQQAVLLSYIDVFAFWAMAAVLLIPAPFVLPRSQPATRGP
jgi:hypothetical protein